MAKTTAVLGWMQEQEWEVGCNIVTCCFSLACRRGCDVHLQSLPIQSEASAV